jgi:hypothetical protein
MRTRLASLSAAFLALVALNGPVAALDSKPELATSTVTVSAVTETVVQLSDAVQAYMDGIESEVERQDDEARLQRILARRGRHLQPGWYQRQRRGVAAPAAGAASSEQAVSYGDYSGPVEPVIVATIENFNQDISPDRAAELAGLIEATAGRYGVDPLLVTALVSQESAFYQSATSPVGAMGLGQLMPETAADLGVNPQDAQQNLDGCVRYLADLQQYWSASADPTALALASYNAGAGNVEMYNGIPPFEETQNYVAVITGRYATLSAGQAVANG